MEIAKGQCNCGEVTFEINEKISDIYVCHCSECRKYTGNNGVAVVIVKNEVFRWTQGEKNISTWNKPTGEWQSQFCRNCGSSLPVMNDKSSMAVPAGSITTGDQALKVAHHIWVGSKATWDEICNGKQHYASFNE